MDKKEHYISQIENYLESNFNTQEKQSFEEELKQNSELRELLSWRTQLTEDWAKLKRYEAIKKKTATVIAVQKAKKANYLKRIIYATSSIAAVLVVGLWITSTSRPQETEFNFAEHDQLEDATIENYASNEDVNHSVNLVAPPALFKFKEGDAIQFKWEIETSNTVHLKVRNDQTQQVILSIPIENNVKEYLLTEEIPRGKYTWFIEGFKVESKFIVE